MYTNYNCAKFFHRPMLLNLAKMPPISAGRFSQCYSLNRIETLSIASRAMHLLDILICFTIVHIPKAHFHYFLLEKKTAIYSLKLHSIWHIFLRIQMCSIDVPFRMCAEIRKNRVHELRFVINEL